MQKVQITIDKKGQVRMEAVGAIGTECENWTKELERNLAARGEVTSSGKKPEYDMVKGSNNINTRA